MAKTSVSSRSVASFHPDPNTVWMRLDVQDLSKVINGEAIVVHANLFAAFDVLAEVPSMGLTWRRQYNPKPFLSEESFRVYELNRSSPVSTFATSATCTDCGGRQESWMNTCRECLRTILRYRLTHPR